MPPYHHGALRQALLEAAEVILERDGIAALTMRAAAREAGVTHAAPAHHFGNLSGLLSELAASGFARLHDHVRGGDAKAAVSGERLARGYVGFARLHPELFRLMFRSERLDWSNPALSDAGAAAFRLLTLPEDEVATAGESDGFAGLVAATARWSYAHGLATLLIDGRLEAVSAKASVGRLADLVEALLRASAGAG